MFGHSFRYHDEIESTNLEAKTLALKGAPEGTVVVAEAQIGGTRPARPALDVAGRQGPPLLRDPAARRCP